MAFTFKHGDRPIEGYEIKRGLGRGGFGEVYYAISDGGREVALKYLHSFQDIELRGVSHCINMKSPNLVSIFDVVKNADGECFVIMEYVSGPSLRDMLIAAPEGLGAEKATFFLREIARGLSYLHERGIVHRDLKPGNIFYEEGYVKIGDYGLSKFIAASAAGAQTQSVGTVHYMAPEVGSGRYSSSIDIYALGVILYEMLLGKVPFEGQSTGEVLMKHLMEQPEVDQLPQPFPGVIRKALAKDPNDRYQNVKAMVEDLLGEGRFERFDTDSLTPIAAFAARNLRQEAPTMPTPTAPEQRPFAGSSGPGLREEPLQLNYADRQRVAFVPGTQQRVRFAGFWIRFLAVIVDCLVLAVPWMLGAAIVPGIGAELVTLTYSVLLLTYWNGQTVGKYACGIRVLDLYGQQLTLGRALGREVSKILSAILCIGYIMAAFTERKQGLHDMIASTYVVFVEPDITVPLPYDEQRDAARIPYAQQAPRVKQKIGEKV
ncbi:MAG: protein kinase [Planctomycetes bacterium]|nr:protein kinase [Planctomycetota bacterium]